MSGNTSGSYLWDLIKAVVYALIFAVIVRSFVFQPFTIPSGSMIPTLRVGDYIIVSKYNYGYSRYSFPYNVPILSHRIFFHRPSRGDIVVFRAPNRSVDYVKRVIGLPGDRVQMLDGILYINGHPLQRKATGKNVIHDYVKGTSLPVKQFEEYMPLSNGKHFVRYTIFKIFSNGEASLDNTPEVIIPEGYFFAMGDDRDNSSDSRVFGPVPFDNLIGKAQLVLFSKKYNYPWWKFWHWGDSIRWKRFFHMINNNKTYENAKPSK